MDRNISPVIALVTPGILSLLMENHGLSLEAASDILYNSQLYCALEDVSLPSDVPIKINTLSDVLFMDRINDISFEIGGRLLP